VGAGLRNLIDLPLINGLADRFSEAVKGGGRGLRVVQTGRVQQYLILGLLVTGTLLSFVLFRIP
jgi:hypothetical protein